MNLWKLMTSRRARNQFRIGRILDTGAKHVALQRGKFERAVIATIAFNRVDLIEWQIYLVKKYLAERDGYIVFDNSTDAAQRAAILSLCEREQVPYIGLPQNKFAMSNSHAVAMNWVAKNFIPQTQTKCFGFLDHDIFPIEYVSITERLLGVKVYGMHVARREAWYLWACFCFFSGVPSSTMNFYPLRLPSVWLDTGGSNWEILYRHLRPDEVRFADVKHVETTDKGRHFEEIDGWLHAGHGAWRPDFNTPDRSRLLSQRLRTASGGDGPRIAIEPI